MKQIKLIEYLKETFKDIEGVRALYIKGSLSRNEGDDFSDVDFYCLVEEDRYEDIKAMREEKLSDYTDILFIEEVNFGLEQMVILYDNNLHLDFYLAKEIPKESTDNLKVVYDPEGLLGDYTRKERTDSLESVIDSLNQSIYTFSEVYAVIMRGDDMWSLRLLSHILAGLSTPMSYLYDKGNPAIHMKGLYAKLPVDLKEKVDIIMELMVPDKQIECTYKLIELTEFFINKFDDDIEKGLQIKYLELIKGIIEKEIENSR